MHGRRNYSDQSVRRRQALGARGEHLAAATYVEDGYRILERNWRCRDGELDLIVARGSVVVFCEVKTRSSTAFGVPAAAVTPAKQQRIRHLAMRWLDEHDVRARSLRFDVAAVIDDQVEILEAAF